jgi:hypothetical protein
MLCPHCGNDTEIPPGPVPDSSSPEAIKEMCDLYLDGYPLRTIGELFGISGERVRQRIVKEGITGEMTPRHKKIQMSKEQRQLYKKTRIAEKDQWLREAYGCNLSEVIVLNEGLELRGNMSKSDCYMAQRANAGVRGIDWKITFPEWVEFWGDKFHMRGREIGKLVMCRKGDAGPYQIGNVFIATCSENISSGYDYRKAAKEEESDRA